MAGHSKWANIQHRKKAQDAKRGKVFTKLIREIRVAAQMGGGDPESNTRLRLAIVKAFAQNMSKDTIERARKKGAGEDGVESLESIRYEGYGPGGVAIMVECLTDNRNRTVSDVRHAFNKCGGNLAADGAVSYLFHQRGVLSFAPGTDEDRLMEVALEAGADDVITNEDQSIDVFTTPAAFEEVKNAVSVAGFESGGAEVAYLADLEVSPDKEDAERLVKLQDMLEDLDDVQNVYTNANLAWED